MNDEKYINAANLDYATITRYYLQGFKIIIDINKFEFWLRTYGDEYPPHRGSKYKNGLLIQKIESNEKETTR